MSNATIIVSNPVLAQYERQVEALRQQLAALKSELKTIGNAIDDPRTDLTMTMSEVIIEQKKQLAAALAACKVKDALLTEMLLPDRDWPIMDKQIVDALAIQPDDKALREWGAKLLEEANTGCSRYFAQLLRSGEWKPEI